MPVDPSIRTTGASEPMRGDVAQPTLLVNPYEGTEHASEFENGYEFAQTSDPTVLRDRLAQGQQPNVGQAWWDGFAKACQDSGIVAGKTAADQPKDDTSSSWALPLAAGGLAAAGMYGARRLTRSTPYGALSGKIRAHGLQRYDASQDVKDLPSTGLGRYLRYGTPNVVGFDQSAASASRQRGNAVVLDPGGTKRVSATRGITADPAMPAAEISRLQNDKLHEANAFRAILPPSVQTTGKPKTPEAAVAMLKDTAHQAGLGKFIVKHPEDARSGSSLMTDETLDHGLKRYHQIKRDGGIRQADGSLVTPADLERMGQRDPSAMHDVLTNNDARGWWHIQSALKGRPLIVQQRHDVVPNSEARVHVIGGKVVQGASFGRHDKGLSMVAGGAARVMGINPHDAMEQHIQHLVNQLPADTRQHFHAAVDVAKTTDGGFSVFETNPYGYSGFLHGRHSASVPSHMMVSQLQGRDTHLLAGARAGLAGLGAAGLAAGYQALRAPTAPTDTQDEDPTHQKA